MCRGTLNWIYAYDEPKMKQVTSAIFSSGLDSLPNVEADVTIITPFTLASLEESSSNNSIPKKRASLEFACVSVSPFVLTQAHESTNGKFGRWQSIGLGKSHSWNHVRLS